MNKHWGDQGAATRGLSLAGTFSKSSTVGSDSEEDDATSSNIPSIFVGRASPLAVEYFKSLRRWNIPLDYRWNISVQWKRKARKRRKWRNKLQCCIIFRWRAIRAQSPLADEYFKSLRRWNIPLDYRWSISVQWKRKARKRRKWRNKLQCCIIFRRRAIQTQILADCWIF